MWLRFPLFVSSSGRSISCVLCEKTISPNCSERSFSSSLSLSLHIRRVPFYLFNRRSLTIKFSGSALSRLMWQFIVSQVGPEGRNVYSSLYQHFVRFIFSFFLCWSASRIDNSRTRTPSDILIYCGEMCSE